MTSPETNLRRSPRYWLWVAIACGTLWYGYSIFRRNADANSLIAAIRHGDAAAVRRLLAAGADPEARSFTELPDPWQEFLAYLRGGKPAPRYSLTALMLAAIGGNCEIARSLIDRGANVNGVTLYGLTPVAYAAKYGHPEMIALLARHGASLRDTDGGDSAIGLAASYGHIHAIRAILENAPDPTTRAAMLHAALRAAASAGQTALIRPLVLLGADANASSPRSGPSLVAAASADRVETVKALLQVGANVNDRDSANGQTALMSAVWHGDLGLVKSLLAAGADVNARSANGRPTLAYAFMTSPGTQSQAAVALELIAHGANVNARDKDGISVLIQASACRLPTVVSALLARGADPNRGHYPGNWTALFWATMQSDTQSVRALLAHGAVANIRTDQGETPLSAATKYRHAQILQLLRAAGARE